MSVAGAKSVLVYVLNKSISIVETLKNALSKFIAYGLSVAIITSSV